MKIKLMTSATLSSYLNELLYLDYIDEIFIQPNCIVNILAVIINNPAFTIFVHHQCLFMMKTFYFHHDNDKYLPVENYDLNAFYQFNFIRMVLYISN